MLLGFKRRFAEFVEEGSKTHTIRAIRKRPPRVGEMCHCYVDPRQKTMRLLGRWRCVKVERIEIDACQEYHWTDVEVTIDGVQLSRDECNSLAWRDGFRGRGRDQAFSEMVDFWNGRLPFVGNVIHWKYEP
jgi:hypothetical protein